MAYPSSLVPPEAQLVLSATAMIIGLLGSIPVVATAAAAFVISTAEGLYTGSGLTILSRNDLNGKLQAALGRRKPTKTLKEQKMIGLPPSSSAIRPPSKPAMRLTRRSAKSHGIQIWQTSRLP